MPLSVSDRAAINTARNTINSIKARLESSKKSIQNTIATQKHLLKGTKDPAAKMRYRNQIESLKERLAAEKLKAKNEIEAKKIQIANIKLRASKR